MKYYISVSKILLNDTKFNIFGSNEVLVVRKVSFTTPSYRCETKSVRCRGVYLNRIRRNNIKQRNLVRLLFPHKTKDTFRTI